MGKIRDKIITVKIWAIAILVILALIFIIENRQTREIWLLVWPVKMPISLALLLAGGIGFVAGFLCGARKARPPEE